MALTFDSLAEDGGRQRAMSLRLPGSDVNSFGGWFPSVSLNALRRLSSTARSEQLSTSLEKPRKRSRISLDDKSRPVVEELNAHLCNQCTLTT
ncbi:putative shikimate kinase [Trichinella spiralis]|uniref:Uncharacterized protein n=1 Tax=Trichinella spiralis TaxID=6334 RepID=E5SDN0_TRISP|nr:putative shikimate kinase [Trichinella spiralis]KRY41309.1 hypothetical protein T01_16266 [Trichinella spiralis]